SQLSICSEPAAISQRNLSCQSSLEPCVPEEESSPEYEPTGEETNDCTADTKKKHPTPTRTEPLSVANPPLRPDTLPLTAKESDAAGDQPTAARPQQPNRQLPLYRSNSSKSFRKPKPKVASKKLSNEYDQIYVISAGGVAGPANGNATGNNRYPNFQHQTRPAEDDHYDSIEVIHERRSKNFSKFSSGSGAQDESGGRADGTAAPPYLATSGSIEGEYRKMGSNVISVVADISPAPVSNIAAVESTPQQESYAKDAASKQDECAGEGKPITNTIERSVVEEQMADNSHSAISHPLEDAAAGVLR
uniref:Uncharacterized protein n=1 Tax=Anopheles maculatus TaxID=74869 RepID=A0A182T0Q2_9DIPT